MALPVLFLSTWVPYTDATFIIPQLPCRVRGHPIGGLRRRREIRGQPAQLVPADQEDDVGLEGGERGHHIELRGSARAEPHRAGRLQSK